MGIFLGDTAPSKIFVGDTQVSKVFVGDTQVRPAGWQPGANTLAYYPFNGDAEDHSGNRHHLSNTGTVSYTKQINNGNYVATRVGGIQTKSAFYTTFNYTNVPLTMIGWCRTSGNGTTQWSGPNKWMLWYSDTNGNGNVIKTAHNDGYYIYVDSSPQSTCTSDSGSYYADDNWHLIIGTFDTTGVNLYVDDMTNPVCSGDTATSGTTCTGVLNIGGASNQNYYSFNGDLSEFIMENKVRTEQERTTYYNQTKGNYGL